MNRKGLLSSLGNDIEQHYQDSLKLKEATKEYVFFKHKAGDKAPTRIVKTEEELTDQDKQLLFGNLLHIWGNTPPDIKSKFYDYVLKELLNVTKEFRFWNGDVSMIHKEDLVNYKGIINLMKQIKPYSPYLSKIWEFV